jgi:hypothetical protein
VTSTQIELSESELPISEVVKRLHLQLEICRTHYGETSWINCHKGIDSADIPVGSAIIFTNFSASLDLRAGETDNSSIDAHAVLDIFVVCHSQRTVEDIKTERGILNASESTTAMSGTFLVTPSRKEKKRSRLPQRLS